MSNIAERYTPQEVEDRIYKWWEESGFFKSSDLSTKPPYSIILPPPNVTGFLHMGHALDHSIQDLMIRYKRMKGFNVMWLPGTDHAGIATQAVVEKELKKEGLNRHQLGRENSWKKYGNGRTSMAIAFLNKCVGLGDSCDWERSCFTLDEGVSLSVRKVFTSLYKRNLIYRGTRLVNWSDRWKPPFRI